MEYYESWIIMLWVSKSLGYLGFISHPFQGAGKVYSSLGFIPVNRHPSK
jgi:hypothetical protein